MFRNFKYNYEKLTFDPKFQIEDTVSAWKVVNHFFIHILRLRMKFMYEKRVDYYLSVYGTLSLKKTIKLNLNKFDLIVDLNQLNPRNNDF